MNINTGIYRTYLITKQRKTSKILRFRKFSGGDKRDRTADLLNAIQALSQLSYTPIFGSLFRQLLYYSTSAEIVKHFLKKSENRSADFGGPVDQFLEAVLCLEAAQ